MAAYKYSNRETFRSAAERAIYLAAATAGVLPIQPACVDSKAAVGAHVLLCTLSACRKCWSSGLCTLMTWSIAEFTSSRE